MTGMLHTSLITAALVLWAVAALAGKAPPPTPTDAAPPTETVEPAQKPPAPPLAEFVAPTDSLPRLRYLADGLVTLNDRCPVRKVRLNPRMQAAYVNGFPVGFC